MKIQADINIGEGLFATGSVDVEVEFADSVATFQMHALTAEMMADLQKQGIKLDKLEQNPKQALIVGRKVMAEVVVGWYNLKSVDGMDIPYSDENRDKLAGVPAISKVLWDAATKLAVEMVEGEEKN